MELKISKHTLASPTSLNTLAWVLTAASVGAAFVAWASTWRWHLTGLTVYQIFPIFGLIAFSTMWCQYVISAVGTVSRAERNTFRQYFRVTGFMVLAAIMLHPGLLIWQLWRDGFGLPPESYLQHYVAPGLRWVALVGTVCLLIFLAYELRYKFGNRSWWRYMNYLVDIAVLAIFYHGLRLGSQLLGGWFRGVWIFYGIVLIIVLLYGYANAYRDKKSAKGTA